MGIEDFPKTKSENKNKTPEQEPGEKVLNPEEIEQLGGEMGEYIGELKISKEKKADLEAELEMVRAEYDGLKGMADDIKSGDFEEITKKPRKSEK